MKYRSEFGIELTKMSLAVRTLARAIEENREEIVDMLLKIEGILESVVDVVNTPYGLIGNPPLITAVTAYPVNIGIIARLLAVGANPYQENYLRVNALTIAYQRGQQFLVEMLVNFQ